MRPIRYIALALFGLSTFHVAVAQSSGIGFKLGPQLSSTNEAGVRHDPMIAGVAGFYVPIWIGPRFEVQAELLGSMQGSRYTDGAEIRHRFQAIYLQLPISGKLFIGNTVNLQAGAQVGKLLSGRHIYAGENIDITDQYQPIDAGFNMGIGADDVSGIDVTLRYYSGLTAVFDAEQTTNPTNRTVQLTLGYRFKPLRSKRRK